MIQVYECGQVVEVEDITATFSLHSSTTLPIMQVDCKLKQIMDSRMFPVYY